MEKQFLSECLIDWKLQREQIIEKIKRYENGERSELLSFIYEKGDLHKALESVEKNINIIEKKIISL